MMQHHKPAAAAAIFFSLVFINIPAALFIPSNGLHIPNHKSSKIRGMFVFGSSTVDNGNNNFIPNTQARADYLPYGIDFPLGPTGRFTNEENIADKLGKKLHLPNYIPPFNNPSTNGTRIVNGVNYASGGSGILDNTGPRTGNVINLNQQIRNFEVTLPRLEKQLAEKRRKFLPEFLFLVATGGNDFLLNYFRDLTSSNVTLESFTANLTSTYVHQIKWLYRLGARKLVLVSISLSGCAPVSRDPASGRCSERVDTAVQMFNFQLRKLTDSLRTQLPGSALAYVDAYNIIGDIIRHPIPRGFRNVRSPCCEVTTNRILCIRGGSVCRNRREYVFFDGVHTTGAVNDVIATKAYFSNLRTEVYPFNVKKLSEI